LGVTKGLFAKYPNQMIDTPLSESAYIGSAIGAATCGLRPIAELMFVDFLGVCLDQVFNQAAKFRYMFGGKAETPVVIRAMCGAGFRAAAQHSQMLTPIVTHIPGLKVVCPSNAYDTKGLMIQAIRDNDPVIFLEHKNLYASECDVPEEPYAIPFGEANIAREGKDVTIVTYGLMVQKSLEAADMLKKDDIDVEVIDLRTLSPIDMDTVIESVEETGRLVCVDEANPRCSIATDVSACVARDAFKALKSPIEMVTPPHTPVPFSPSLEDLYIPSADRIADAVRKTMEA
jgi:pyruvate dehydrogenase E1 component beta subunit